MSRFHRLPILLAPLGGGALLLAALLVPPAPEEVTPLASRRPVAVADEPAPGAPSPDVARPETVERGEVEEIAPRAGREPAGARIAGRVRLSTGRPIAGATVAVGREGEPDHDHAPGGSPELVRTDSDGRYEIGGIEPGRVRIVARAQGTREPALVEEREAPAGRLVVEFVFTPGTPCSGHVVDEVGSPVPGATVRAQVDGLFEPLSASGDEDGAFRFDALPGRSARLLVEAAGCRQIEPATVSYDAGSPAPVVLEVVRAGALIGRVLDPAGRGFTDVRVEAESGDGATSSAVGRTDRNGRFRIAGLPPGRYRCRAICQGYPDARSIEVAVEPGSDADAGEVRFELGASLSGRVVAADGAAIAGARVEYRAPEETRFSQHVVSGPEGEFEIAGLAPGSRVVLRARARGHSDGEERALEAGEGAATLVLEPIGTFSGVVCGADGAPVAGAWVAQMGDLSRAVRTDAEGRFALAASGRRDPIAIVHASGHPAVRVRLTSDQPNRIALLAEVPSKGVAVEGRLTSDGTPVAGVLVLAASEAGSALGSTDDSGRFLLILPGAGSWELAALDFEGTRERLAVRSIEVGPSGALLDWDVEPASRR